MNKLFIDGRLTRDAEVKTAKTGKPYTKFSIAHNEWAPNDNEKVFFLNVTCFKEMALEKGTAVIIEGRLDISTWESDGEKKSSTGIIADRVQAVQFLSLKKGGYQKAEAPKSEEFKGDDIPF